MTIALDHLKPDYRPQIHRDTAIRSVGDEAVVWGVDALTPQYLSPAAALLLSVLDGEATSAELAEDVSEAVDIELELAEAHVARTVSLLAAAGALVDTPAASTPSILDRKWLPEPNW